MVSKFAILTNILLASGALAVSSRLEARLAHLRQSRQSTNEIKRTNTTNNAPPEIDDNGTWSGAAVIESERAFTTVTGTFIVPTLNGTDESSSTAWVGLGGSSCREALLQAGVDIIVTGGRPEYNPWVEFYPAPSLYFSGFNVSAGDEIRTTVTAFSDTSGQAVLENLTTNQTVSQNVSSTYHLCGRDCEWIVEDFEQDIPFAKFGLIKFTNATASGPSGRTYTPEDATIIYNIQRDNDAILTSVSVSNDTVSIERV